MLECKYDWCHRGVTYLGVAGVAYLSVASVASVRIEGCSNEEFRAITSGNPGCGV